MPYLNNASANAPALVIYLLDVSTSMQESFGGVSRIETVSRVLERKIIRTVMCSVKGNLISSRYRIGILVYGSGVVDLLGRIVPLPELAEQGIPQLYIMDRSGRTAIASAFLAVEELLKSEIPNLPERSPAPLVCHMTDGEFNGEDPRPVVERIKQLSVPDGNVLVENVYIKEGIIWVSDVYQWPGISSESELSDADARVLFQMSSLLPENYRNVMTRYGYNLAPDVRMLFPGNESNLVELGCLRFWD